MTNRHQTFPHTRADPESTLQTVLSTVSWHGTNGAVYCELELAPHQQRWLL